MLQIAQHLSKSSGFDLEQVMVRPGRNISLSKDFDAAYTGTFKDKSETQTELAQNIELLAAQQDVLYADDRFALLLIFQALDAAGKDGTIKHVMSGVNPRGVKSTASNRLLPKN